MLLVKLGMITIGQAPRTDVAPIMEKYLENRAELVQMGALDGLTKTYIDERMAPGEEDYILTSRLTTGEHVVMSRSCLQPLVEDKIKQMENLGITQILLLCTGQFPGLATERSYLIEPDHILPPVVRTMTGNRRLGILVPLPEQMDGMKEKFHSFEQEPVYAVSSPYTPDKVRFMSASRELKEKGADLIILDCMGYQEEMRAWVEEASGLPVILSNALMAKLISEMIG
ncbi:AroM family protein [Paenibacillus larvae]|uniref:AroM family protein n=1 Tax=Paenibacillus larvae TaxID=1464 RepID=A0AAP5MZS1_9BACL|nr:AroM family protein [Paenibacillus larvae]AQR78099.1 AroM protein [Paenibacillus larvae subsp. larvae]AVF20725.1 protein AroM [Paenibacillus larvae subsp. larvae]ETK28310.1 protein AroM [Paenibacillus larvae subsp. larvae DSM 25719]MCY7490741.1 AroM family protein [Paenibacillus larvae]MCY9565626.1 AroM family protein [Paenibacillus larvae]